MCLVYLAWGWADDLTDLGGDSAMYMLMARYLSPFHPTSAVIAEAVRTSAYPPLFPLLIGLFGGSMLAGHLVAVACLLAALPLLFLWLRTEGLDFCLSAWLTAVFALMPGTCLLALNIWTENPYLLFSLAALLAWRKAEAGCQQVPLWLAAAMVSLALLTRAAALPLLAAFVAILVLRRPRHWPGLLGAAVIPFALWAATTRSPDSGFGNYLQQWTTRYHDHLIEALLGQSAGESKRLLEAWIKAWTGAAGLSSPLRYPAMALGLVCLAGWLYRLIRLRFDAIYLALYGALLLLWPFPAEAQRLEYVIVPVLLVHGGVLVGATASALRDANGQRWLAMYAGAATLLLAPSLILTVQRHFLPTPGGVELVRHIPEWYGDDRLLAAQQALVMALNFQALHRASVAVPAGNCIFSIKPAVVTLYAERASYLPPASAAADHFERELARCRYLYPMALVSPSFAEPFYPLSRLAGRGRIVLTAEGGDTHHWDTYGLLVDLMPSSPQPADRP